MKHILIQLKKKIKSSLNKKIKILSDKNWIDDVKVKDSTPEGLFTKSAQKIVDGLLKESNNDIGKAIKKLVFYMNRCGDSCSNKTALNEAKKILQKKLK